MGQIAATKKVEVTDPGYIGDTIEVSWTTVENADGYRVYLYESNGNIRMKNVASTQTSVAFDTTGMAAGVATAEVYAYGTDYSQNSNSVNFYLFDPYTPWWGYVQATTVSTYTGIYPAVQYGYVDNTEEVYVLAEIDGYYYIRMHRTAGDYANRFVKKNTIGSTAYTETAKLIRKSYSVDVMESGTKVTIRLYCNVYTADACLIVNGNEVNPTGTENQNNQYKIFTFSVDAVAGTHTYHCWISDADGNRTEDTISVQVAEDQTHPDIPEGMSIGDFEGDHHYDGMLRFEGTVSFNVSGLRADEQVAVFVWSHDHTRSKYIGLASPESSTGKYSITIEPYNDIAPYPEILNEETEEIDGITYARRDYTYLFIPTGFLYANPAGEGYIIDGITEGNFQYLIDLHCAGVFNIYYFTEDERATFAVENEADYTRCKVWGKTENYDRYFRLLNEPVCYVLDNGTGYVASYGVDSPKNSRYILMPYDIYEKGVAAASNVSLFEIAANGDKLTIKRESYYLESYYGHELDPTESLKIVVRKVKDDDTYEYVTSKLFCAADLPCEFHLKDDLKLLKEALYEFTVIKDGDSIADADYYFSYYYMSKIESEKTYYQMLNYAYAHNINPLTGISFNDETIKDEAYNADRFVKMLHNRYAGYHFNKNVIQEIRSTLKAASVTELWLYLYALYEYDIEVDTTTTKFTHYTPPLPWWNGNKIYIHADVYNPSAGIREIVTTFFHESGHAADYRAKKTDYYSSYRKSFLEEDLKQDIKQQIYFVMNKGNIITRVLLDSTWKRDQTDIVADYLMNNRNTYLDEETGGIVGASEHFKRIFDVSRKEDQPKTPWDEIINATIEELCKQIKKAEMAVGADYNALMCGDVTDGMMVGKISDRISGHDNDYFVKETINNENGTEEYIRHLVECEAFAEYYATMITGNTKAQEYNAAFFPKTCIALSVIENTMLSNISGQHNQAPNPDP